jgi:hypothetical protein
MSTIGCAKSSFQTRGTFGVNRAPFLHQNYNFLQTDQNELPLDPHHLGVQSGAPKMISEPLECLAQTAHLS